MSKLSRSKIELFIDCPVCFFLDVKHKISRPSSFPFTLNNAVDELMKREFDLYREKQTPHPIQLSSKLDFLPANDSRLELWRNAFAGGLSYTDAQNDTTYFGVIDDLWVNSKGEYAIVDYKATANHKPVDVLPSWATSYQRQLEFYTWLLKLNGLKISSQAFIVYATADKTLESFNNELKFHLRLLELSTDLSWIDPTLKEIDSVLTSDTIPQSTKSCKYCSYRNAMP